MATTPDSTTPRPLSVIAADIRRHWPEPYFAAVPYLRAMAQCETMDDTYGAESAYAIVCYLIGNLGQWKGDDARRVKAELRAMVKAHEARRRR